jgi:hypothetical protein
MSDDIGPGDVVEALHGAHTRNWWEAGDRAVVTAIHPSRKLPCGACGQYSPGFNSTARAPQYWLHCLCGWRKIGGSQAQTVSRFAEDLSPARPKVDA